MPALFPPMPLSPLVGQRDDEDTEKRLPLKPIDKAIAQDANDPTEIDDDYEYVDQEDGSQIIRMRNADTSPEENDFYRNLAETLDEQHMNDTALDLIEKIEDDKKARKKRDDQQAEGLQRTGLGNDAPGGADFPGASRVVHPGLLSVNLDFAARTIKELYPANGPVRMHVRGKQTPAKTDRAKRKSEHMNFQFTYEIKEYRPELEQLLTQVPMGGSQYMWWWHDPEAGRHRCEFVPIDDVLIPFHATSFVLAGRKTRVLRLDELEFNARVRKGLYRDVDVPEPPQEPEPTKSETATRKIEGKEQLAQNIDGVRMLYEVYVLLDCPDDKESEKDRACPYIITIDDRTRKVLAWYRNWEENDEHFEAMEWGVEFAFIPWRGVYAIGLPHMMGTLSGAQTGSIRALLDSAHISNSPTALLKKGSKLTGQSQSINPTGVSEIDAGLNVDDIRAAVMPLPFNGPSPVLVSLLGYLDGQMGSLVRMSMDMTANDTNANTPVGTQISRVEQGLIVFSSIFARLHQSQQRCFEIVHRLNRMYLPEKVKFNDETIVLRKDYDHEVDVQPVSDPAIFSELQRYAQLAEIQKIMVVAPGQIDPRKYAKAALEQMKWPNPDDILVKVPEPKEQNAILENMQMMHGQPAVAYPLQDHLAHIQTHLSFFLNPAFGQLPVVAPRMIPQMLEHMTQHLGLWYVTEVYHTASEALGNDPSALLNHKDPMVRQNLDKLLAAASQHADVNATQTLQNIPPIIAQAVELLKKYQMPPPMDPSVVAQQGIQQQAADSTAKNQIAQQELARKQAKDQADAALAQQRLQSDDQRDAQRQQTDAQKEQQRLMADAARQAADAQRAAADRASQEQIAASRDAAGLERQDSVNETKIFTNSEDNRTAKEIVAVEIMTGEKSNLSTGTGINP